ncbi:MAG: A/G-specific adenine glycosylase [Bacteroidetes bacterium]|nr:A/G-specific adenine glycosylase [Bacteroidota bacterium]
MNPVSHKLIHWYKANKRDLPWRHTKDAYHIWLSEIIMQQTQVVQGLAYYNKFVERYRQVSDLAKAPEDEVMRLWQGLGYYSRARNLHAAAKHIHAQFKGKFPDNYNDIRALKGVGDYTAAAVASFAFDLPHAVVDGNVYRVLSRLFGISTPINSTQGKKEFQQLADELLDRKRPALHNSAMMEFGALHCRPQNPGCESCVLQSHCYAFQHKAVHKFPVKEKAAPAKERFLNYIVLKHKNQVYIRKRTEKDIWQNLYEFMLIETAKRSKEEKILTDPVFKSLKVEFTLQHVSKEYRHILSHQILHAVFYVVELRKPLKNSTFKAVNVSSLDEYGFPRLIGKFLGDYAKLS